MQVTSDTLFHFTTSLKNLENILLKKFHLTYCQEKYTLGNETHDSYYPMISFCDIPLSLAKNQIRNYGSYGIGMTKEWGIKNKLNPAMYIEKTSLLGYDIQDNMEDTVRLMEIIEGIIKNSSSILKVLTSSKYYENNQKHLTEKINSLTGRMNSITVFKDLVEKRDQISFFKKEISAIKAFNQEIQNHVTILDQYKEGFIQQNKILKDIAHSKINFFRYVKNYQGSLIRKNKTIKSYRFYDEREWRYVPAIDENRAEVSLNEDQYKEYRGSGSIKPLIKEISLNFTSNDIKYLIVKSNKDIPKLIKSIPGIDNLAKNTNEAAVLTTKIMTVDQLEKDF